VKDSKAAIPCRRLSQTLYRQLGLDANKTTVRDLAGRPQYLVDHHQPMPALL
jgi:hypothetical protein